MTFTLQVDAERWRAGADGVRDAVRAAVRAGAVGDAGTALGDVVPVTKGNGYGLGNDRLARESTRLGVPTLAVGTVFEVAGAAAGFGGDLLVLTPEEPADTVAAGVWAQLLPSDHSRRIIRTLASPAALSAVLATATSERPARVVLEGLTTTGRFGYEPAELRALLTGEAVRAALDSGALIVVGLALHLPMTQPGSDHRSVPGAGWHDAAVDPAAPTGATARVREVLTWARGWQQLLGDVQAAGGPAATPLRIAGLTRAPTLWLSHLSDDELTVIRCALPGMPLRLRLGTRLWLGDRSALTAHGTVLAVHHQQRGDRTGYRQRRAGRDGALLVVGGGTAHGVALAAPSPAASLRQRVVAAGTGALEATGRALSPFTVAGRQRWFAEPPHMQVSLLRLPAGVVAPAVGDLLTCDARLTTATFDRVLGLD